MITVKPTKNNNYGRGFYYECEDGYSGWVLGLTGAEKVALRRQHGKLIKYIPA